MPHHYPPSVLPRLLTLAWIDTPLGPMTTIADEHGLYALSWADRPAGGHATIPWAQRAGIPVVVGTTPPIACLRQELTAYFQGILRVFSTPYHLTGTPFQQRVWHSLRGIPYGHTLSYPSQAISIANPNAVRAVANANGANPLAILIPCHRVISSQGTLGGYNGGRLRKQWLLEHENRHTRLQG